jgi:hypothetical protein
VFSGIILDVHSFQGGEVNGPKETQGNCKIATPLPHHMGFRLLMGRPNSTDLREELCIHYNSRCAGFEWGSSIDIGRGDLLPNFEMAEEDHQT